MSKKLAESLDALVLDVKFGSGAFMKSLDDARTLARSLVDTGKRMGVQTTRPAHRHEPAAGADGGQPGRGPRVARGAARAQGRPTVGVHARAGRRAAVLAYQAADHARPRGACSMQKIASAARPWRNSARWSRPRAAISIDCRRCRRHSEVAAERGGFVLSINTEQLGHGDHRARRRPQSDDRRDRSCRRTGDAASGSATAWRRASRSSACLAPARRVEQVREPDRRPLSLLRSARPAAAADCRNGWSRVGPVSPRCRPTAGWYGGPAAAAAGPTLRCRTQHEQGQFRRAIEPDGVDAGDAAADVEQRRRLVIEAAGIAAADSGWARSALRDRAGESARRGCGRRASGRSLAPGPGELVGGVGEENAECGVWSGAVAGSAPSPHSALEHRCRTEPRQLGAGEQHLHAADRHCASQRLPRSVKPASASAAAERLGIGQPLFVIAEDEELAVAGLQAAERWRNPGQALRPFPGCRR